jgi:hypothetical protein
MTGSARVRKGVMEVGYVLLGHGGMNVDPAYTSPDMESVAIPQGTTIQFYSDTNQALAYGPNQLDVWERFQAPWPPLDSRHVTYNLHLDNARSAWRTELAHRPRFGGNSLILPGLGGFPESIRMCTGTPDTCPTKPEQVANGMSHRCDGILATLQGDLHWLACTVVDGFPEGEPESQPERAAANAVIAGRPRSAVLGHDPDWVPNETDQLKIAVINRDNLRYAIDGVALKYVLGGFAFLVGGGHEYRYVRYARNQYKDTFEGRMVVSVRRGFNPGRLEVFDVPPSKEGIVEAAVSLFSDAVVVFPKTSSH